MNSKILRNEAIMQTLEKFAEDLRQERVSRASLFWLRIFLNNAQQGLLRSDHWIEAGLREGADVPGLDPTALAPRLT